MTTHPRLVGTALIAVALAAGYLWFVSGPGPRGLVQGQSHSRPRARDAQARSRPRQPAQALLPVWDAARVPLLVAAFTLLAGGSAAVALRLRARRRRIAATETWEIMLGREDLAMPYEVQQALEGICGRLRARWYERGTGGQDHIALGVRHTDTGRIAFTATAPPSAIPAVRAAIANLYPDARLQPAPPDLADRVPLDHIGRLKKRRSFIFSLATTRDYQHSFMEELVAALAGAAPGIEVQLVLTPAPLTLQRRARRLLERHERAVNLKERRNPIDSGRDSVVASKDAKGALETQQRSLYYFDLRVAGRDRAAVRSIAGLFEATRSENELVRRYMRIRAQLYRRRIAAAAPNPIPGICRGVISCSELATLWHLPRTRMKHAPINRASSRRAAAQSHISRAAADQLMRDEQGPVGLRPSDRKFGLALVGGQGMGKTSTILRVALADALDPAKALIVIDPKEDLARLLLGLIPEWRTVHYLDLGAPECGVNPLAISGSPESIASLFVQSLIEASPPGAIQSASDAFLRNATTVVAAVEGTAATPQHVYEMLRPDGEYRRAVVERLAGHPELAFLRRYWDDEFPQLIGEKRFAAERLDPPKNKLSRLITSLDVALRHPRQVDLEGVIERGEVLIVNGAKGAVGEDNTRVMGQVILQLLHRALQHQQRRPAAARREVGLCIDEAHNFLTPTVATLIAEGRSAGLLPVLGWQYSAQIQDELIRSGFRSLLQSISIFRMRELEDARSMAGLAMEVYADRIDTEEASQERLRFSVDDTLRLPQHHAINLWVAAGGPRPGFIARTLPMESYAEAALARRSEHHLAAQRERGGGPRAYLPDPVHPDPPAKPDRV